MPMLTESIHKMKQVSLRRHTNAIKYILYLPLTGKVSKQQTPIDLKLLTNQFLTDQTKALLLQGSAGTGKTIFCHHLMVQLLENKEHNSIIPFYISLKPEYSKNHNLIESVLQEHEFSSELITELRQKGKFLFILDGFEQLGCFQNIYSTYQLERWQAKILITCRPEYFANIKGYQSYFIPYQANKPQFHLFKEVNFSLLNGSLWSSLEDEPVDKFYDSWIVYHKQKYKFNDTFEKEILDYCIAIAKDMRQKNRTKIIYKPASKLFNDLANDWQKYFDPKFATLRMVAPIIKAGNYQYEFIRTDLLLYFAAKNSRQIDIFSTKFNQEEEQKNMLCMRDNQQTKVSDYLVNHYLNQKLITQDSGQIQFLADRIWQNEIFKKEMFALIVASKLTESITKGAANAITILNYARVTFSGMDLSEIRICGADISLSVFDSTNLQGADLRNVNMQGAWLRNANFKNANMESIKMGQWPMLELPSAVISMAYLSREQWLAIAVENTVNIYDMQTQKLIYKFEGDTETINSIVCDIYQYH